MALGYLACPACGAALPLAEGQRLASCAYCGRRSLVLLPDAVPRYVVAPTVDRTAAADAARGVLGGAGLPAAIRRGGVAIEWTLCYVPFYEITGVRVGTFVQRESPPPRAVSDPDLEDGWAAPVPAAPRVERIDTRVVEQELLRVQPACTAPQLGIAGIPLAAMRRDRAGLGLEPYDLVALQRKAVVLAPDAAPQTDRAMSVSAPRRDARTRTIEERVKLLYYPVWQGQYAFVGRRYAVSVDGTRGEVLSAHAPLASGRPAALVVALLAVAGFAAGRLLRALALDGRPASLESLVVAGTLGAAAVAACVASVAAWRLLGRGLELAWEGGDLRLDAGASGGLLGSLLAWLAAPGGMRR